MNNSNIVNEQISIFILHCHHTKIFYPLSSLQVSLWFLNETQKWNSRYYTFWFNKTLLGFSYGDCNGLKLSSFLMVFGSSLDIVCFCSMLFLLCHCWMQVELTCLWLNLRTCRCCVTIISWKNARMLQVEEKSGRWTFESWGEKYGGGNVQFCLAVLIQAELSDFHAMIR